MSDETLATCVFSGTPQAQVMLGCDLMGVFRITAIAVAIVASVLVTTA